MYDYDEDSKLFAREFIEEESVLFNLECLMCLVVFFYYKSQEKLGDVIL
jgi:hypothetical protein